MSENVTVEMDANVSVAPVEVTQPIQAETQQPGGIRIVIGQVEEEENIEPVYIVRINMATPMRVLSSEMLDERTEMKTFRFNKETRSKIATVRCRVRRPMTDLMFDFEGLWLCSQSNLNELKIRVGEADRDLKAIDGSLYADITAIPLDVVGMRNTKAQKQIITAIRLRMRDEITERIATMRDTGFTKAGNLNAKMVKTSIKMLERLKTLNVFEDAATDEVLSKAIEELTATLSGELHEVDEHLNKLEDYIKTSFTRVEVE